jgi:hypothetical protein
MPTKAGQTACFHLETKKREVGSTFVLVLRATSPSIALNRYGFLSTSRERERKDRSTYQSQKALSSSFDVGADFRETGCGLNKACYQTWVRKAFLAAALPGMFSYIKSLSNWSRLS